MERLTIEVSRDGWTRGLQVSINQLDENGNGDGYRIAGPKFNGSGTTLLARTLNQRDADEIRAYLDAVFPARVPSGRVADSITEGEDERAAGAPMVTPEDLQI